MPPIRGQFLGYDRLVEQEHRAIFGEVVPISVGPVPIDIVILARRVVRRGVRRFIERGLSDGLIIDDHRENIFDRNVFLGLDLAVLVEPRSVGLDRAAIFDRLPEVYLLEFRYIQVLGRERRGENFGANIVYRSRARKRSGCRTAYGG